MAVNQIQPRPDRTFARNTMERPFPGRDELVWTRAEVVDERIRLHAPERCRHCPKLRCIYPQDCVYVARQHRPDRQSIVST